MDSRTIARILGLEEVADQIELVVGLSERYRAEVGAPIDELSGLARSALEKLSRYQELSPAELQALEQAVRMLRPILRVRNGGIPDLPDDAAARFPQWSSVRSGSRTVMANVARIDGRAFGEEAAREVATAFAVTPELAITNAHVVDDLSLGVRRLEPGRVELLFGAEFDLDRVVEPSPVTEVVGIHADLDIAIVRFEAGEGAAPMGLPVSSDTPDELEAIAVPGFPQHDDRNPSYLSAAVPSLEPVYKRVAPGIVRSSRSWGFVHDASTLGGNSGSPVLRMADLRVVGVHSGGGYRSGNDAQGAHQAAAFLEANGIVLR